MHCALPFVGIFNVSSTCAKVMKRDDYGKQSYRN
jgi:hypothetical protein